MLQIMPDGTVTEMKKKSPEHLKRAVSGNFERVYLADGRIMVINQEAEEMGYALNPCASILLVAGGGRPGDFIVGPAILCGSDELD